MPKNELRPLTNYDLHLDGLRGLAFLVILGIHCRHAANLHHSTHVSDTFFHEMLISGWMVLEIFFSVSGYIITSILLGAKGKERAVQTFYIRRFFRIIPLFYGYLFLIFVALPLLGLSDMTPEQQGTWPWHVFFATNFFSAQGWESHRTLGHLWTLALEAQFYLLWPWIVLKLPLRAVAITAASVLLGCCVARFGYGLFVQPTMGLYTLPQLRFDGFMAGALMALVAIHGPSWLRQRWIWKLVAVWSFLFAMILGVPGYYTTNYKSWPGDSGVLLYTVSFWAAVFGFALISIAFSAVIALLAGHIPEPMLEKKQPEAYDPDAPRISKPPGFYRPSAIVGRALRAFLGWTPIAYLGRISYGAYVFHMPVIHLLTGEGRIFHAFRPVDGGPSLIPYLFCFGFALVTTTAVAALSWHFFEEPLYKVKNRFPYGRSSPGQKS
jgi:peptidoglycan/LPS O-acetylase OafA/YrhL